MTFTLTFGGKEGGGHEEHGHLGRAKSKSDDLGRSIFSMLAWNRMSEVRVIREVAGA